MGDIETAKWVCWREISCIKARREGTYCTVRCRCANRSLILGKERLRVPCNSYSYNPCPACPIRLRGLGHVSILTHDGVGESMEPDGNSLNDLSLLARPIQKKRYTKSPRLPTKILLPYLPSIAPVRFHPRLLIIIMKKRTSQFIRVARSGIWVLIRYLWLDFSSSCIKVAL